MNTSHLIIKKILNVIDNDMFLKKLEKNTEPDFYKLFLSYTFVFKPYSIENKFILYDNIVNNMFINNETKQDLTYFFYLVQKTYYAFSRLSYLYKLKKAKIIIDMDLCMNKIQENKRNVFCLFQNSNKYLFNIHDLIKIIENSISNTSYFFNNPLPIKNPYNNVYINKSSLYNIYFFIREKTYLTPELFFCFFKTNFNLNLFTEKYQYLIREHSIHNYLKNTSVSKLCDDIFIMLDIYNLTVKKRQFNIIISDLFPKDKLVEIMKPYLHLYYLSEYSLLDIGKRTRYRTILKSKLEKFQNYNPTFGRKFIKFNKIMCDNKIKTTSTYDFNMKHISFNESNLDKSEFMNNHNSKYRDYYDISDDNDDTDDENEESDANYDIVVHDDVDINNDDNNDDSNRDNGTIFDISEDSDSEDDFEENNDEMLNNYTMFNNDDDDESQED
jgi:hypothetical protein